MAKQTQPTRSSSKSTAPKSTAQRKKAASPSEKSSPKVVKKEPPKPPIIDEDAHRNIVAIVCTIAALALVLIVGWPTNAIVTSFLSLALRLVFGVGAYLLPLLLIVVAVTFVAKFDNERMPVRIVMGLGVIFFGFLILVALFTPGAIGDAGVTQELLSDKQVIYRGGYVGAGPAWLGLTWFGLPVSCVIAVGIMAIGLAIIGFSVKKLAAVVRNNRIALDEYEEDQLGVAPDAPYVPAIPARMQRNGEVSPTANTLLLDDPTSKPAPNARKEGSLSGRLSGERTMAFDEETPAPRSMTRKLGSSKEPKDEAAAPAEPVQSHAKTQSLVQTVSPDESFELPDMTLIKKSASKKRSKMIDDELSETAARLQQTLEDFGIMADVVDWIAGPTVTLFEVDLPPGVRVSRITALNDDIALTLAAPGVRIFAPIPGTHFVGIEVPNATRENVLLGDVLKDVKGGPLEMAIGKDVEGNSIVCDLAKMPHLLIGGTTGSGKSVGINAMIMSMLMRATPSQVRFIMIDPKRVEFTPYNGIPHLYVPVVTEPKEAASELSWGVAEMERRLKVFSKFGARNISQYNEKVRNGVIEENGNIEDEELPYIVIIIDELADLMMNVGKEVEFSIARIAQLARAAGIHLIVATQRPSANVVTGLIKANITNRIAFNVASGLDSRVILDVSGAESLIGNGDMLLSKPEYAKPVRIQGCYVSPEEIEAVVEAVKSQGEPEYHSEILKTNLISLGDTMPDGSGGTGGGDDPLIWDAAEIVVSSGLGSTSNIQRKLKVGYSRAGRIMDMLEEKGVVGPPNGSKPRDVLVDLMELETLKAFEQSDT